MGMSPVVHGVSVCANLFKITVYALETWAEHGVPLSTGWSRKAASVTNQRLKDNHLRFAFRHTPPPPATPSSAATVEHSRAQHAELEHYLRDSSEKPYGYAYLSVLSALAVREGQASLRPRPGRMRQRQRNGMGRRCHTIRGP